MIAVVVGVVIGSIVNMAIVTAGPLVIPLPEGADVSTMEKMKESMPLFQPVNFIPPFLAHALGTLVGAFLCAKIAGCHKMHLALGIGVFFVLGGIMAAYMLKGPMWFNVTDIALAYIPMAYLGAKLAGGKKTAAAPVAE